MHNENVKQSSDYIQYQKMDSFISPVVIPTSKLDADQYVAEDLDGVTESLFGSGNLNFLIMQSSQTNALLDAQMSSSYLDDGAVNENGLSLGGLSHSAATGLSGESDYQVNGFTLDTGRQEQHEGNSELINGASNNFSGANSSVNASSAQDISFEKLAYTSNTYSSGGPVSAPAQNGKDGVAGRDGQDGAQGSSGQNGSHGSNGNDGQWGHDACCSDDVTLITIINDIDINFGDVINIGDVNLGDITIIDMGDVTNLICLGDIINIIDLGDVTNLITTTVENVTNIIGDTVMLITDITVNIIDPILDVLCDFDGITLDLNAVLSEVVDLDLGLISGETVLNVIDQVIDLGSVTDLLDPIVDLDGIIIEDLSNVVSLLTSTVNQHHDGDTDLGVGLTSVLGDTTILSSITDVIFDPVEDLVGDIDVLADLGLDLFDTGAIDNLYGDSDVSLNLGLGLIDNQILNGAIDIPLDPIEAIIGDIDLDIGVATNLLGDVANGIIDDLSGGSDSENLLSMIGDELALISEPLAEELDITSDVGINLFDQTDIAQSSGDTDLSLDVDLNLLGIDVLDIDFVDVPLDPIESLLGDIDLGFDTALDLLNLDTLSGDLSDLNFNQPGNDLLAWTESILPDSSSFFSDNGLGHVLPEPVGDLIEGLGGLFSGGDNAGSGLFGNHFGGLFG